MGKNPKAGDLLKVSNIQGGHLEADFQSCYPDRKVFECNGYALCGLLSLNATDTPGNF